MGFLDGAIKRLRLAFTVGVQDGGVVADQRIDLACGGGLEQGLVLYEGDYECYDLATR